MNKFIMLLAFFVLPILSMDLELSKITEEDTGHFVQHFKMAVDGFLRKIQERKYHVDHSFGKSLFRLQEDLKLHGNDIKDLITDDQDLKKRLNIYNSVDSNVIIQRALDQVRTQQGDVKKAKDLVIQNRRVLAELKLQEIQPLYSLSLIGEVDTKERENFVQRNINYPTDENAVKDYMALFIYLTLFANKVE
jgi:hypothetical protein